MRWSMWFLGFVLLALLPAPCRGKVDAEAVNRAIDRRVALLKKNQQSDGSWRWPSSLALGNTRGLGSPMTLLTDAGLTALAGLTLLHCGVPATDPAVVKAADFVRLIFRRGMGPRQLAPPQQNRADYDKVRFTPQTYSVSLASLFLDRLGADRDRTMIRKLGVWLVEGQRANGGWTYRLDHLLANDQTRIDNSNTQFAVLGLWAAQHHGVRVGRSLAAVAQRFYVSQGEDGGWSYWSGSVRGKLPSVPSMTCAALLVLAYRHATANKEILEHPPGHRALAKTFHDPSVVASLAWLEKSLQLRQLNQYHPYYSLWSLERVAAAFDLDRIGGVDWYDQAAQFLLANQRDDGSWFGDWPLPDTCFALLVLRRANLSPDMTAYLKGQLPPLKPVWSMPLNQKSEHQPDLPGKDIREGLRKTAVAVDKKVDTAAIQPLLKQLAQADGSQRNCLLHTWRDGEDERYTPALAQAIATLSGSAERKARAALADRLTRLTVPEREECLRSDDPEIRRAAVLSCAVRDDRQHLARLIELLQDKEAPVSHAAHAVLCSLTGQDFGPDADASQADRNRAVADWKEWALRAAGDKMQKKKSRR